MTAPNPAVVAARRALLSKCEVAATGCLTWTGRLDQDGYGRTRIGGQKDRAHRTSYSLFIGVIPAGLVIDHLCRVRHCINPDHLEAVTLAENSRRAQPPPSSGPKPNRHYPKSAEPRTHCFRGHLLTGGHPSDTYNRCRTCHALTRKAQRARARA